MAGRNTVVAMLERGLDHAAVGRALGITPGAVHLIATGIPADGSDSVTGDRRRRVGFLPSHAQRLVNGAEHAPDSRTQVLEWIGRRVADDPPMQAAAAA